MIDYTTNLAWLWYITVTLHVRVDMQQVVTIEFRQQKLMGKSDGLLELLSGLDIVTLGGDWSFRSIFNNKKQLFWQ